MIAPRFTFGTDRCPRMFVPIPFVGCRCVDCRIIEAYRAVKRWGQSLWRRLLAH